MTIKVGINGFGRIGKCVLLQLLELEDFQINAINTSLDIESIGKYINRDSVHGKRNISSHVLDEETIILETQVIKIVNSRDPSDIDWRDLDVDYLFETTGAFLTLDSLDYHDVDNIILSSPPKDNEIMLYCYGVNHPLYRGERVVSTASCTTNCIAPILDACLDFSGGIKEANFITIHSATASQSVVDTAHDKTRTNRSIFNNIIPHTTGASKCLGKIIPEISGKIRGTSVRVPVSNVSMVDLNITFNEKTTKKDFFKMIEEVSGDVITVSEEESVSSDFIGYESPSVIDYNSTYQVSERTLKITLWYDNEWSYAAQMIRMCRYIFNVTKNERNVDL